MDSKQIKSRLWKHFVTFAQTELGSVTQIDLHAHSFSRPRWERCGIAGIQGLPVPKEYGGQGYSASETAVILEALGYGCPDNGLLAAISAHLLSCVVPVWKFGSEEQKKRYLPSLCNGVWVAAHGATEPEAGSDIFHLQTSAERRGDNYILSGTKIYILSAPVADLFIVFARLNTEKSQDGLTAFLVERETPGFSVVRTIDTMGLRHALMGEVTLDQCAVPQDHRLGTEGYGSLIFQMSMGWERTLILATHLGTMRRVLEKCVTYAQKREQFGQRIGKFQSVSNSIADMRVRIEAGSLLLYRAAQLIDKGNPDILEAATVKLFLSEAAVSTYLEAIRIHGALGYTHDTEFAEDLQDAVGTLIFSGTSDIQRQIIGRLLGI